MIITAPNGMTRFDIPSVAGTKRPKGRIFFVDSALGSDGQPAESGSVFKTIAAALAVCATGNADTIYVYPGTYTFTATLAITISNVSIIGLGGKGMVGSGVTIEAAALAGHAITITDADKVEISNITIHGAAGYACIKYVDTSATANGFGMYWHNLKLNVPSNAASYGILTGSDANDDINDSLIENVNIICAATAAAGILLSGTRNVVKNSIVWADGGTVTAGILTVANKMGALIDNCRFMEKGGTFTLGINDPANYTEICNCISNMGTAANFITQSGTGGTNHACQVASGTV